MSNVNVKCHNYQFENMNVDESIHNELGEYFEFVIKVKVWSYIIYISVCCICGGIHDSSNCTFLEVKYHVGSIFTCTSITY